MTPVPGALVVAWLLKRARFWHGGEWGCPECIAECAKSLGPKLAKMAERSRGTR